MQGKTRGGYFLASDGALELAHAFLNSSRRFNPEIPMCLIPFDAHFSEIAKLREKFNFSIFSSEKLFDLCDEISRKFHGHVLGAYRKLFYGKGFLMNSSI